jgi:hypothetical protein
MSDVQLARARDPRRQALLLPRPQDKIRNDSPATAAGTAEGD